MKVEFVGERTVDVRADQSILEAALKSGIPHFHACGGKAKCSTCRILVLSGGDKLSSPNRKELKLKEAVKLPSSVRLACQTFVLAEPVTIDRIIKDQGEINELLIPIDNKPGEFKIQPLGEEKYLVMFFIDLRNFTVFIQKYLPFDIIYIMRKLFELFTTCIKKYNGQVIETAGDQLFAVFGCENTIRESADAAIRVGQEILDQLKTFNSLYSKIYLNEEFGVGIGVHGGKVIVGKLGISGDIKTSVMGLGVNIASRIQEATKELNNSFLVSDEVVRQSSFIGRFETNTINLRGVAMPIVVHKVGFEYNDSKPLAEF